MRQEEIDRGLSQLVEGEYQQALAKEKSAPRGLRTETRNPFEPYSLLILEQLRRTLNMAMGGRTFLTLNKEINPAEWDFGTDRYHEKHFKLFEEVFRSAVAETKLTGAKLSFLYLHNSQSIIHKYFKNKEYLRIREIVQKHGVPMVDASERFAKVGFRARLFGGNYGPHYSAKGYNIVAETLVEFLKKQANSAGTK